MKFEFRTFIIKIPIMTRYKNTSKKYKHIRMEIYILINK